jgi:hypothetical protein
MRIGAKRLAQDRPHIPMKTLSIFAALIAAAAVAAYSPPTETITGGNATMYLGARPNRILILDEATEKVTGFIPMKTGYPESLDLSKDKTRFYVHSSTLQDVEVVDIAKKEVVDTYRLSEGNKRVWMRNFEADPTHKFAIIQTRGSTKLEDHFEITGNELLQYDLKEHKVMRKIPWPKGEEREFVGLQFSPDGKWLYMFSDDLLIYDTTEFKEVDKWELSRPLEDGFGRINFNSTDDDYEEPGFSTGIFTVNDAVQNRRIMGIARINLGQKSVDFYALGPATGLRFALAPGRKLAYGLHSEIGKYEFWGFDLEHKKLLNRVEFPGRPRMSLKTSSNGKLLYIFTAGNTIDIYEAATYKYLRTITMDADMTTGLQIIPKK